MHEWTHNLLKHNRAKDQIAQTLTYTQRHMNNTWSDMITFAPCLSFYSNLPRPTFLCKCYDDQPDKESFPYSATRDSYMNSSSYTNGTSAMWFTWLDELANTSRLFVSLLLLPLFEESSSYIQDPLWQPIVHWAIFF